MNTRRMILFVCALSMVLAMPVRADSSKTTWYGKTWDTAKKHKGKIIAGAVALTIAALAGYAVTSEIKDQNMVRSLLANEGIRGSNPVVNTALITAVVAVANRSAGNPGYAFDTYLAEVESKLPRKNGQLSDSDREFVFLLQNNKEQFLKAVEVYRKKVNPVTAF